MKSYEPKPLNKFQQSRAPHQVSDESFADLREQMVDEKLFFRDSTYSQTMTDFETGTKCKLWFDKKAGKWVAEFSDVNGGVLQTLHTDSRDELLLAVAFSRGQTVSEQIEAEREANPVFNTQWETVVHEWLTSYRFGREFASWSEYLSPKSLRTVSDLIRQRVYEIFKHSAQESRNVERAYMYLLDEGSLDKFETEAAENKKIADIQAAKDAERDALSAEMERRAQAGYEQAMAEDEYAEDLKRLEADKKLAKTPKGMAELRRRALFGDKENAFPVSSGTAQKV